MKSKNLLVAFLIASAIFTSCNKETEEYIPQEVDLTLDYTFVKSGSMTRATGAGIYNNFYEKYIKNKELTPAAYSLTFKNKTSGATASVYGYWKNKDAIRLVEGDYEVTGTSSPADSYTISDTVFISFNETVRITKDMKSINLTAIYDSYLLLLDNENFNDAYYYYYYSGYDNKRFDLLRTESNYFLFIKALGSGTNSLKLTRNDGKKIEINLNNIPFEKGKYYYFNDMTNSFDIPPMEAGN